MPGSFLAAVALAKAARPPMRGFPGNGERRRHKKSKTARAASGRWPCLKIATLARPHNCFLPHPSEAGKVLQRGCILHPAVSLRAREYSTTALPWQAFPKYFSRFFSHSPPGMGAQLPDVAFTLKAQQNTRPRFFSRPTVNSPRQYPLAPRLAPPPRPRQEAGPKTQKPPPQ